MRHIQAFVQPWRTVTIETAAPMGEYRARNRVGAGTAFRDFL
ncbi:MAG: hypothetical protein ACO22Z_08605 [Paracoccaceae bacterium]|jgi:hypothetical protein